MADVLVIGAGPAGLMAAEVAARAGARVSVLEARPSPARKLLMAGRSGLNLTRDEAPEAFAGRYSAPWIGAMTEAFGPPEVRAWAESLGVALFAGSTGRVFPVEMKASPLLRAWLARLAEMGVRVRSRWRWTGFEGPALSFDTPEGPRFLTPGATVLALGGASWPRLGSDAAWVPWLAARGVEIAPFRPANMGFEVAWSDHMRPFFGQPVKGLALQAGALSSRGEMVISARGIEGGGIYEVSAAVRDGAVLTLDLCPDRSLLEVTGRLGARGKTSLTTHLRKALRLDPVKIALVQEWGRPLPQAPERLARLLKALPVRHDGPRPLAEAISSAGGITRAAMGPDLELAALPGVFAAGEMLDWEAPTGGYLLTACLATGRIAGQAAARHVGKGGE